MFITVEESVLAKVETFLQCLRYTPHLKQEASDLQSSLLMWWGDGVQFNLGLRATNIRM